MEKARLKKSFRYIPGDIIRKEDLNLENAREETKCQNLLCITVMI